MAQAPDTVDDFLLYLAKNANPKRFFPFPEKYRIHLAYAEGKLSC